MEKERSKEKVVFFFARTIHTLEVAIKIATPVLRLSFFR